MKKIDVCCVFSLQLYRVNRKKDSTEKKVLTNIAGKINSFKSANDFSFWTFFHKVTNSFFLFTLYNAFYDRNYAMIIFKR